MRFYISAICFKHTTLVWFYAEFNLCPGLTSSQILTFVRTYLIDHDLHKINVSQKFLSLPAWWRTLRELQQIQTCMHVTRAQSYIGKDPNFVNKSMKFFYSIRCRTILKYEHLTISPFIVSIPQLFTGNFNFDINQQLSLYHGYSTIISIP